VRRRDQTIERLKKRNRIAEMETESVKDGLVPVVSLSEMTSAAAVTEAVLESAKVKKSVYSALHESGFTGVPTTHTSSLTRISLLDHNEYPDEKFATTHFFNPVFDSWKPSIVEDVMRVMSEFRRDDFLRLSTLLITLAKTNPVFYSDQKPNEAIYNLIEIRRSGFDPSMLKLDLLTSIRVAAARTVELDESPATVDFISTEGLKSPRARLAEIDEFVRSRFWTIWQK
jgi:hypothetical protein